MSTILITGASSGLGAEMARQFAALGHDLALCARRTERLDELAAEIAATHPDVTVSVKALDVNDHDAVFRVFEEFREELGGLDRVVVNAGLGKGQPLGTGRFDANRQTAETNFIGALAQTEAAAGIFRAQGRGHLVMVSSFSALRGMPRNITTYAASKAAVAHLAEGFRADVHGTPIKVTVLYPGYIVSEMSGTSARTPLVTSTEKGVRAMVEAIEKEKRSARVPAWPWAPLGLAIKHVPVGVLRRLG
ncbi:short-chain dehydrogenase [Nocardioides sp. Root122]|uniref:SDR family oxidoreductase n=1 Tax=Nocardioides TaxID=1839 RepID=UPI000703AD1A|nr:MULTISPECIES: SDR family oxidoreductase [Nocardioides]KQV67717.1 short-chain dehydrogenase [Nocardioides sp. Root122]MCK9823588.1 SDR family oxidoreductase [Nocardioides cavernae]